MSARFDLLQDQLLTLYETASTSLESQIKHWDLTRKLNVLMFYAKKENYKTLGLQTLPTTQVSEYNAKLAIKMTILLRSLSKSRYGNEPWTLPETSAELVLTAPKNTFKKEGYSVEVQFDNDPQNVMVYTQWKAIYYQDLQDVWHKVPGEVDHNGLSYTDVTGEKIYFLLFHEDAERYGNTGQWTVKYENTTISSVVTSSSKPPLDSEKRFQSQRRSRDSSPEEGPSTRRPAERHFEENLPTTTTASPETRLRRRRRGERGGEGEYTTRGAKRRRGTTTVIAEAVGSSHRSVPAHNLSRLRRLEEEARDPYLICLKGPSNNLKCWRYRVNLRFGSLYQAASSVFKWIGDDDCDKNSGRMLIAFSSNDQRTKFLHAVNLPKGSSYSLGALDSL